MFTFEIEKPEGKNSLTGSLKDKIRHFATGQLTRRLQSLNSPVDKSTDFSSQIQGFSPLDCRFLSRKSNVLVSLRHSFGVKDSMFSGK